jgi:uncharacterized protein YqjF (DUF2071 family)
MRALDLDRLTPTRPPEGRRRSGSQRWEDLLFVHWRVDAARMREVVPRELELDLWDGQALVGVVPFVMKDIRLGWMPRGMGLNFLETNLRTYVHYKGEPGVYFFSLEASSWLAVQAARRGWGLPYFHANMATTLGPPCRYETTRRGASRAHLRVSYAPGAELGPSILGSFEFFLLERYYLFALQRGRVMKGHVHHVPYPARSARLESIQSDLIAAAGLAGVETHPPVAVHYSEGVTVDVFGPWAVG